MMKRRWFGAAAAVLAACAIYVFSARRIEAQYSSPVKVVNTTSAPAIGSLMDDHGRIPYQSEVDGGSVGIPPVPCDQTVGCDFVFGPVPAGHRLVIERVTGVVPSTVAAQAFVILSNPNSPSPGTVYAAFTLPPTSTAGYFEVPTLVYVDSQQSVDVTVAFSGAGFASGFFRRVIVKGYLLDCTAAPCAAIAH
jgi:hypothetical protein